MIVGITGGIGSGKSSLARLLAARGAALVDADRIGHQVLGRPEVRQALVAVFGPRIALADGCIDRRELARRAFASQEGHEQLTRIVRPPLEEALWREIDAAEGPGRERLVVVDAALIFEWGVEKHFALIVAVDAPEELRLRRAAARQGLSQEEIRRRLAWQLPAAEKAARAHLVVENNGSPEELEQAASQLWDRLQRAHRGEA